MKQSYFLLILFCFAAADGYTQKTDKAEKEAEMNADMPDETEETSIVGKGVWQIETAFLHNGYKQGKSSAIGQALIRYGVSHRLELRLLAEEGRQRDRYAEETVQSTYPLAASAKLILLQDHNGLPDITFVTYLQLPATSRSGKNKERWSPIFLAAFGNKFGEKLKLEYNGGVQQEAFSSQWVWLGNGSVHYKILKPLEIFAEYYAQYAHGQQPEHNLGGGISYQAGRHVELYLSAGSTVDYDEPNHFISGGVAVRIP